MSLPAVYLALALLPGASTEKLPTRYAHPDLLLEPAELAKPAVARRFRLLDARDRDQYLAGHIPGAVWVDHDTWAKAFAAGQDEQAWAKRIGRLGINRDTRVVVYHDQAVNDAARIWWILRYWGVRDVRLLNGGWLGWNSRGGAVTRDEPNITAVDAHLSPRRPELITTGQLLASLGKHRFQIVDARSEKEYCGDDRRAKRNGAIPGALNLDWVQLLDPKTRRFKTPAELTRLFRDAHIDLGRPTVAHCQSGGRAAAMVFALDLMGARDVRNYYRGWSEWGNARDTPIVTPKPQE